jgi:hypothetical protein
MNRDQFCAMRKQGLRNFVDEVLVHVGVHDQKIGNTDDADITLQSRIRGLRHIPLDVECLSIFALQGLEHAVVGNHPDRDAGGMRKIQNRRGGNAAAPEERIDFSVFECISGL